MSEKIEMGIESLHFQEFGKILRGQGPDQVLCRGTEPQDFTSEV
jgi:hypothetical protein